MLHYHVGANTPGYLPDSEPHQTGTLREAQSVAQDMARDYAEADYMVRGNRRDGYVCTPKGTDHPLDVVVWIERCADGACAESNGDAQ